MRIGVGEDVLEILPSRVILNEEEGNCLALNHLGGALNHQIIIHPPNLSLRAREASPGNFLTEIRSR
jgi:hypothetical protein